jgi:ESS family glutamate:Na+ symporter
MSDQAVAGYLVSPLDVLILSILVLFLGMFMTRTIPVLARFHIPPAVSGGLVCSIVVALIHRWADLEVTFDLQIRDLLLLVFFSTIGLNARFKLLIAGGKALAVLVILAGVFLIAQDATGVALALLLDTHPGYGLFAGSVSLAGGHGTAIAWGEPAQEAGLAAAADIGIAFATFGLIAGGLIGGPVAGWLIDKHGLEPDVSEEESADLSGDGVAEKEQRLPPLTDSLGTLLLIAICVELGSVVNRFFFEQGVLLPGFLTSLLVGIVLANTSDMLKIRINPVALGRTGELSLYIFLSMSMMSMQLWVLMEVFGTILFVMFVQCIVITLFAVYVVFWLMGRDYDAAVICAGFTGMGLGATPVAIANMSAITGHYGPSPKAMLVVPLVGAFFIDIMNALVIKFFVGALPGVTS